MSTPVRNAEPSHIVANDRTFFVTSSISDKRAILQSERAAKLFIDVLYHYRGLGKYLLHEFVIMPDHFHLLLTVDNQMTIEKAVQLIKGGFAFRAGRELALHAPVWQKGFSEIRVTERDAFWGMREYIHANPVKRFLAQVSEDYPYSSAHSSFVLDPAPQRLKAKEVATSFGIAKAMP
jgi:putative transposase